MFSRRISTTSILLQQKIHHQQQHPYQTFANIRELQPKLQHQSKRRESFVPSARFAEPDEEVEEVNNRDSLVSTSNDNNNLANHQNDSSEKEQVYHYASSKQNQKQLRHDLAKIQRNAQEISQQLGPSSYNPSEYYSVRHPNGRREKIMSDEAFSKLKKDVSGNVNHVPRDCVTFVADEFKRLRELETIRRKKILAELASPDPFDYTYDGKLVPVPPLNFGQLAPQSFEIAQKMLVTPTFRKVREAPASDYFFEINEHYCEISFIGRANAGKSSLINAILGQQGLAKTSSVPHSTRNITFYQSVSDEEMKKFVAKTNPNKLVKLPGGGLQYTLVDVPGFGIDGMSDKWRDNAIQLTDSYFGQRRSVNTVFMCIDVEAGVTPTDETYFEWMTNVHGVFWIVLTKCDSVSHSRLCSVMGHLYKLITNFQKDDKYRKIYPFVLPVSAKTGVNIDFLRALIVETSGVLPADTLRKLLQQKKGDKWDDAIRDEEMRLLEEDEKRKSGLEVVRKLLAEKRGFLLTDENSNNNSDDQNLLASSFREDASTAQNKIEEPVVEVDDDDFAVFDTEFNPFAKKKEVVTTQEEEEQQILEQNGEEQEEEVLSFDVPDVTKISASDTEKKLTDENTRIGQFKLSSKLTGMRKSFAVSNTSNGNNNANMNENSSSSTSSSFAAELAEKLSNTSLRFGTNKTRPQQEQHQQQKKRHRRSQQPSLLIEQEDGSLVSSSDRGGTNFNKSKVSTTTMTSPERRFEMKKQRRLERLQEDDIWSKYQPEIDKGNAIATASAWREIKEHRQQQNNNMKAPSRMSKKEMAAYQRHCGGTTVTHDAFVDHTRQQMSRGEQRKAKTNRKAVALEYNHSGRMQLNSQPGGLWHQYGSANAGGVNASDVGENEQVKKERRVLGW